ncbi:MAG TPA: hypothetical protein VFC07_10455 [Verrucomicrobiae bacterium]|nr:hypothetical protein [Verrucomicrobiae bacterium]
MSEPISPAPERKQPVLKFIIRVIIGLILLLLFFGFVWPVLPYSGIPQLIGAFAFGWLRFFSRTVPKISLNADLICMGVLCIVLILFLAHRFMVWISASIAASRKVSWIWPWKWTWCGLGAVLLLFFVGMAMGGMVHQIGWITSSPEPWYEIKGRSMPYGTMRQLELVFRMAKDDTNGNFENVRRAMKGEEYGISTKTFQDFHFLFITEERNNVGGFIIFPRNPQERSQIGALYSFGEKQEYISSEKLPDLLRRHQAQLVAF